jgi:hypothetical protein
MEMVTAMAITMTKVMVKINKHTRHAKKERHLPLLFNLIEPES